MPTFPSQQDHALNQPRAPSFLQQNQQQLHRSLSSQNIKSMHQYSFYQQEKSRSRNSSQEHLSKGFYHKGKCESVRSPRMSLWWAVSM